MSPSCRLQTTARHRRCARGSSVRRPLQVQNRQRQRPQPPQRRPLIPASRFLPGSVALVFRSARRKMLAARKTTRNCASVPSVTTLAFVKFGSDHQRVGHRVRPDLSDRASELPGHKIAGILWPEAVISGISHKEGRFLWPGPYGFLRIGNIASSVSTESFSSRAILALSALYSKWRVRANSIFSVRPSR